MLRKPTALLAILLLVMASTGEAAPRRRRGNAGEGGSVKSKRSRIQDTPANTFADIVKDAAANVLHSAPAVFRKCLASNTQLASAVLEELAAMRDPDSSIPPFRQRYTVAVWNAVIKSSFDDVISEGKDIESSASYRRQRISSRAGVTWTSKCSKSAEVNATGEFGWPCRGGGAVFVQGGVSASDLKSCAIAFHPGGVKLQSGRVKLKKLQDSVGKCGTQEAATAAASKAALDLTAMSHCIFTDFQDKSIHSTMKLVAVIPSFVPEAEDVGFQSPEGGVLKITSAAELQGAAGLLAKGVHLVYVAVPVLH